MFSYVWERPGNIVALSVLVIKKKTGGGKIIIWVARFSYGLDVQRGTAGGGRGWQGGGLGRPGHPAAQVAGREETGGKHGILCERGRQNWKTDGGRREEVKL